MQDEISSIDQIDITIVLFVFIYGTIGLVECNDTGTETKERCHGY